jgi:hypothetical protein
MSVLRRTLVCVREAPDRLPGGHHAMPVIDSQPDGVPVWFDLSSSDPAAAKFYGDLFGWGRYELPVEFSGYSRVPGHPLRTHGHHQRTLGSDDQTVSAQFMNSVDSDPCAMIFRAHVCLCL